MPAGLRLYPCMSSFWEWIYAQLNDDIAHIEVASTVDGIQNALGLEEQMLDNYVTTLEEEARFLEVYAARWRVCCQVAVARAPYGRQPSFLIVLANSY